MNESKQLSILTPAQVNGQYQQAVTFAGEQIKSLDKRISYLSNLKTLNEYQQRDLQQLMDLKAALEGLVFSANQLTQWRYERHLELSEMHETSVTFEALSVEKFKALYEKYKETESQLIYALDLRLAV